LSCALEGRNHAELLHLGEDVDDPAPLSDSAACEPDDENLVYVTDLPVGGTPMYAPWWVPVTDVALLVVSWVVDIWRLRDRSA
jgi:hypothetical protein